MTRKLGLPFVLLATLVGCRDATAPSGLPGPVSSAKRSARTTEPSDSTPPRILRQAATAPRLRTYLVSFWARRGTQTTVAVNYRRLEGQETSDLFLRFKIPINGLVAGADGVPLERGDSVRITLTIDSTSFLVDFHPSGVAFSKSSPAQLAIWYQHADPDLNGDGAVDANDEALRRQLAIWSESGAKAWRQLSTKNNATEQYVASEVQHFSQYAVSW